METPSSEKIKYAFKQVLKSSKKKIDFKSIGYLPRWLILCFDMFICLMAVMLTSFIVSTINTFDQYSFISILPEAVLILMTNLLFFLFFRTYAGLIRHSTFIDAIKFFLASLATLITLLVVNYSYLIFRKEQLFLIPSLFIYFALSFSFLLLFRVLVKQVFEAYFNSYTQEDQINVLIYGIDTNAIAISNAFKVRTSFSF